MRQKVTWLLGLTVRSPLKLSYMNKEPSSTSFLFGTYRTFRTSSYTPSIVPTEFP